MNKVTILLIAILLVTCKTSAIKNEDIVLELTKEEQLNKLYQEKIKPLFSSYIDIKIPLHEPVRVVCAMHVYQEA